MKSLLVKVVGRAVLVLACYAAAVAALQLIAVACINAKRPVSAAPVSWFERNYYANGGRHIWQEDPACAVADPVLIYKPRNGACAFSNAEFQTTLNFDDLGRAVPDRPWAAASTNGIAVLGDSQAMGWGVSDGETFANVLQQRTTRPVYNLAVSSYGTERELKRLVVSGVVEKVDTLVIQYSENDLGENQASPTDEDLKKYSAAFERQQRRRDDRGMGGRIRFTYDLMKTALADPLVRLSAFALGEDVPDFSRHLQALRNTLQRYEVHLRHKRVFLFYANEHGRKFANFPEGQDARLPYLTFVDPGLGAGDYFAIDDHLNPPGHRRLGEYLARLLR